MEDAEIREQKEERGPRVSHQSECYLHIQDVFDIAVALVALVRDLVTADEQSLLVCQLLLVQIHDNRVDELCQIIDGFLLICLRDDTTTKRTMNCFSALMATFRLAIFLSLSEIAAYIHRNILRKPKDR